MAETRLVMVLKWFRLHLWRGVGLGPAAGTFGALSLSRKGSESRKGSDRERRQQRNKAGWWAEFWAIVRLVLTGHRILGWRCKTPQGEIDIIALRGRRLAFIEVKQRRTRSDLADSIGHRQVARLNRAIDGWLDRHPGAARCEVGVDAMFVCTWRWPEHRRNYLVPLTAI